MEQETNREIPTQRKELQWRDNIGYLQKTNDGKVINIYNIFTNEASIPMLGI